jgi:hypothetical protein
MRVHLREVLKRQLKSRNESVNAVARNCGIPLSVLHGWLHGVLPSAKNLHHIQTLSQYLDVEISMLLFNVRNEKSDSTVLFSSEFKDGDLKYRLLVEKIRK